MPSMMAQVVVSQRLQIRRATRVTTQLLLSTPICALIRSHLVGNIKLKGRDLSTCRYLLLRTTMACCGVLVLVAGVWVQLEIGAELGFGFYWEV